MTEIASQQELIDIAAQVLDRARVHGADAADAVIVEGSSTSASCRMGKLEDIERSEARDLGIRVFVGRSSASVSSTDFSPAQLDLATERAVAMARAAPPDKFAGLAGADNLASDIPDLDLYDDHVADAAALRALAEEAEAAALEVAGVTNSLGASASTGTGGIVLATSEGFVGAYRSSSFSISCSVVAGEGTAMERDYDYSSALHFDALREPAEIGRSAAEKAVRRLKPRKPATRSLPVVYDPRVSASLLGHLAGAISGSAITRGTSFLKDKLGTAVFATGISVIDDAHRRRGLRSKPFDGEGVANKRLALVEEGVLQCWLLDSRTARQLGLATNGRASRGVGSPPSPSPTNLYLAPGTVPPAALMADIAEGLYVTDLIGMGVNGVTGDYSRGAAGFWIENGELAYAVSECTIAGNLGTMFAALTAADDLEFRYGTNAPTVRIEGMTVAGS
jgi:PmbA protein